MEFTKHLQKLDGRRFQEIQFGDREQIKLSIQAGEYHYSTPRRNVDVETYSHFELLVVGTKLRDEKWASYKEDEENELYAYVPKAFIESLFQGLKYTYGLSADHQQKAREEARNRKLEQTNRNITEQKEHKQQEKILTKQKIVAFATNRVKQQVLVGAMNHVSSDTVYAYLGKELEKTIQFTD